MAAEPQTIESLRREFADPPKAVRPIVRWWWPGGDVTPEELRREIRVLDEAGFAGAEIQPFRGELKSDVPSDVAARVKDYPTSSFWQKVRAAAKEARQRGMFLDLSVGSGWPLGGGAVITPELASIELRFTRRSVSGPRHFRERILLPPPRRTAGMAIATSTGTSTELPAGWQERLRARTRVIAVMALQGTDPVFELRATQLREDRRPIVTAPGRLDPKSFRLLTAQMQPDGLLEWDVPAGQWQLFVFFQQPVDTRVIGAVGTGPQLVLDHMNRAAVQTHLKRIFQFADPELGSMYGGTIRAGFSDSLEVEAEIYWTDSFLEEFRRRRGYDLTPWLPFIDTPGRGDVYPPYVSAPWFDGPGAARARLDYWKTVSELWIGNFFGPLIEELHARGLMARVQAHGAPVDLLKAYALADIPETEQVYAYGAMGFLKAASSAGHIYGRPIVSAESFDHSGMAYKSTRESLTRDANRLIAAGVNLVVYHGFPYVYLDRPEPGWYPFAGPPFFSDHFNDHNSKIWPAIPALNAYISRLQLIARRGRPVARYALYRSNLDYTRWISGRARGSTNYDYINDDALEQSAVRQGKLVAPSGAEYEALVVPVDSPALRKRFPGLRILVGKIPPVEESVRWRVGDAEFRLYFDDSDSPKDYVLGEGPLELWDAATGTTAACDQDRVRVAPGKALLVLKY